MRITHETIRKALDRRLSERGLSEWRARQKWPPEVIMAIAEVIDELRKEAK